MLKATKVSKTTQATAPLETFVASLGIQTKAELYSANGVVYVNSDVVTPVLGSDLKWFTKNAEVPLHYIIIKKKIYINKYGLTKLLAQSKEAVAFKLQDYLYELLYQVESKGTVSKADVVSRHELIKTLSELDIYKSIDTHNKLIIDEKDDSLKQLRADYAELDTTHDKLKEDHNALLEQHRELEESYEQLKDAAKKIAKLVRIKSKNPVEEVDMILTDGEDEDEELSSKQIEILESEVKEAKKTVNSRKKAGAPKRAPVPKKSKVDKKLFYLMRSASHLYDDDGTELSRWHLAESIPEDSIVVDRTTYETFKDYCNDYNLGVIDPSKNRYEYLWYEDVFLTEYSSRIISIILRMLNFIDRQKISEVLELIKILQ